MRTTDEQDLIDRAMAAFIRAGGAQPADSSDMVTIGRRQYIRLINAYGLLAVYECRPGETVLRLDSWPAALGRHLG